MAEKAIPEINQDFDFKLILHVISKNLIWIVFLFILAITSAFLIIRYTKPIYRAKSTIQLTSSDGDEKNILDSRLNPYDSDNLAKEIELIRSPVFLSRVIQKIPVDVSYYVKGAILNFETYKSSPFTLEYDYISPSLYGKQIDLEIIDENSFSLHASGMDFKSSYDFEDTVKVEESNFVVLLRDFKEIHKNEKYYFLFNNPQNFVKELTASLSVKILSDAAKTIEISYTGFNPQKVADVVNGVAMEFEYFNLEKKQEGANRILGYIDRTLGIVSTSLNENEKELNKYRPEEIVDSYVLQMEQSKSFDMMVSIEQAELALNSDLSTIKRIEKIDINSRNDVVNISALIVGSGLAAPLSSILDRFTQLYNSYDEISYSSPEGSAALNKVKYQIEQQKKAYSSALNSLQSVTNEKLVSLRKNRSEVRIASSSSGMLDTNNLSASMIKRIKEVNEKYYNQLIEKKAEYAIAKEGFTPEYQILEFALVPEKPIAPDKLMIVMTALGSWFLLSFLLVGIRYLLSDEILLPSDISKYTSAPMLGMIHKYKENIPVSQLVVDKKSKGLIAEAFRTVRTNLQFIYNEPGPKVIALTSTISGEGKTFVSMNLAGILAFSGNRTIVIDCDMRKPKIHVGFEVDNEIGMSTILIGKNTIEECVRASQMENLSFITAGPIPPNPSELLLSPKMAEIIDELKTKYDYIVIDNPPSGLVSDAVVNLQRADYPIYVFRSDYSRKFFINNLTRLKNENKISKISCILNSVDLQKNKGYGYSNGYGSYNYGYGYGYGFGYYEEEAGADLGNKTKSQIYNIIKGRKNTNL